MASINVTEYDKIAVADHPMLAVKLPPLAKYDIAISGTSTQGPPFQANTKIIRVETDTGCRIAAAVDPSANTTTDVRLAANQTEYFGVEFGLKLAVIQSP